MADAGTRGRVRACAVVVSNRFVACDDRGGLVVWRPALVVEPAVEDDDAPQIRVDVALAAEADDADDFDALRREFEESRRAAAEDRWRAREERPAEEPRRRRRASATSCGGRDLRVSCARTFVSAPLPRTREARAHHGAVHHRVWLPFFIAVTSVRVLRPYRRLVWLVCLIR